MSLGLGLQASDVKTEDLGDGFVRITAPKYVVEIPKGWEVGRETSFGQREYMGADGEMGTMTGSAKGSNWDRLYQTSLFFIRRSMKGEPTPYKIVKAKQGYEAMTFNMMYEERPVARYVILMNDKEEILALSVKIPTKAKQKEMEKAFQRMVDTAKMR